jgi:hypothetical protein
MLTEVGAVRLELTASWSQTKRATDLRYAPLLPVYRTRGRRSNGPVITVAFSEAAHPADPWIPAFAGMTTSAKVFASRQFASCPSFGYNSLGCQGRLPDRRKLRIAAWQLSIDVLIYPRLWSWHIGYIFVPKTRA